MRRSGLLILTPSAVAVALLPALAVAWTPYDSSPPWATGPAGAAPPSEAPPDYAEMPFQNSGQVPGPMPGQMPSAPPGPGYGYGPPVGYAPLPGYVPPGYGGFAPPWPGGGAPWGPGTVSGFGYGPGAPGMGYGPAYGGAGPGAPGDAGGPSSGAGSAPFPGYPDRPARPQAGGLRVSQTMTDDAYVLEIPLDGQRPESIQVEPQGRGLLIRRDSSAQVSEADTFDDGRGYAQRYSYATGRASRRLSVPPDGDLAGLSREDGPDSIRIRIPRRQP